MTKNPPNRPPIHDTAMTGMIRARVPIELEQWVKAQGNQADVIRRLIEQAMEAEQERENYADGNE